MVPTKGEAVDEIIGQSRDQVGGDTLTDRLLAYAADIPRQNVIVGRVGIKKMVVAIAQADNLAIGEMMIDLGYSVIAVLLRTTREEQSSGVAVAIIDGRGREQCQDFLHGEIGGSRRQRLGHAKLLQYGWSRVVGSRLRNVNRGGRVVVEIELSRLKSCGRHRRRVGQRCAEARQFLIEEKESLVLDYRTTDRISEQIAHIRVHLRMIPVDIDRRIKPVASPSKCVPAPKFVSPAVELVASTLGHHINNGACVPPIFRIEVVGDDAEFLRGIRVGTERPIRNARHRCVIIVHAVEQEVVVTLASAVH